MKRLTCVTVALVFLLQVAQSTLAQEPEYVRAINAKIKSHIAFTLPKDLTGNLPVEYEIELRPDGLITSIQRLKSSGVPGFDEAVRIAVEKSQPLPPDKSGAVPGKIILSWHLKDDPAESIAGRAGDVIHLIDDYYLDPVPRTQLVSGCITELRRSAATYAKQKNKEVEKVFFEAHKGTLDELRPVVTGLQALAPDVFNEQMLAETCVKGMASMLDAHSAYYDQAALRQASEFARGQLGDIGIQLALENGVATITSIRKGSPASLHARDRIVKIGDSDQFFRSLDELLFALRGAPGTHVRLTVLRKGSARPVQLDVERRLVEAPKVVSKTVNVHYLLIRIDRMGENTLEELAVALQEAEHHADPLRGLILDLRNNPGGPLAGSIGVAAVFLPKDVPVLTTKGRYRVTNVTFYARPEYYVTPRRPNPFKDVADSVRRLPMVVLVNRASAAGAEAITGALQDHKRAPIIGERTNGAGTVQSFLVLAPGSALKLTSARLIRPSGVEIDRLGVTPDILVEDNSESFAEEGDEVDKAVAEAIKVLSATVMSKIGSANSLP